MNHLTIISRISAMILSDPGNVEVYVTQAVGAGYDLGRDKTNYPIPVIQLSKEGEYLNSFPSINQAAEALDLCDASIGDVVRGKQKTSGGYKWKLLND